MNRHKRIKAARMKLLQEIFEKNKEVVVEETKQEEQPVQKVVEEVVEQTVQAVEEPAPVLAPAPTISRKKKSV